MYYHITSRMAAWIAKEVQVEKALVHARNKYTKMNSFCHSPACVGQLDDWFDRSFLKLNDGETEEMVFGTGRDGRDGLIKGLREQRDTRFPYLGKVMDRPLLCSRKPCVHKEVLIKVKQSKFRQKQYIYIKHNIAVFIDVVITINH